MDVLIPRVFELSGSVVGGRYQVLEMLGEGGMATVYAGRPQGSETRVAIKVLKPHVAAEPLNVRRFLREARASSLIAHDNIVKIVDFGQAERHPVYFVMEFLDGQDLKSLLAVERALSWERVRHIALQITAALQAAHGFGVVHRDVKPGNIFVMPGVPQERIKVLDFGIAKVIEEGRGLTKGMTTTKGLIGTVAYMAPEQARSEALDQRTDIYQLGVVLYQMLSGRVPFSGGSTFAVLERHLHEAPRPLREFCTGIPQELESIVLTCLAKLPEERFQSMAALRGALQNLDPLTEAPVPQTSLPRRKGVVASGHTAVPAATVAVERLDAGMDITVPSASSGEVPSPRLRQTRSSRKRTGLLLALLASLAVGMSAGSLFAAWHTAEPARALQVIAPAPSGARLRPPSWRVIPLASAESLDSLEVQPEAPAELPARRLRPRKPIPPSSAAARAPVAPPVSRPPSLSPALHPDLKSPFSGG